MERCGACGEMLPFRMDDTEIIPCPKCGSTCRTEDGIKERIVLKAKPHGATGKPELEITLGDDFHRKEKKWKKLKRVIDRGHDQYEERVVDPTTSETTHECREPLIAHTGHGCDKKNKRNKNGG
jgi:hypothetical protein